MCSCFTCKEEGWLEPALPLVAALVKKPSYAPPSTLEEFLKAQSMDSYCKQADATFRIPGSTISYARSKILVPASQVDNAIQKVLSVACQPTIIYLAHPPVLSGLPRERKMFGSLCSEYYWPLIVNTAYHKVKYCYSSPMEGAAYCHQMHLMFSQWAHLSCSH